MKIDFELMLYNIAIKFCKFVIIISKSCCIKFIRLRKVIIKKKKSYLLLKEIDNCILGE